MSTSANVLTQDASPAAKDARPAREPASGRRLPDPQIEIVVPVKDEEAGLRPSIRRLHAYLTSGFPFAASITIADNGSKDGTWARASELARELPGVSAIRLPRPGRGAAFRAIWSASSADVLAYLGVDLSTDLNALLPLVAPLLSGHSDVAIGTRLARGSRVRGPRREVISRCSTCCSRPRSAPGFPMRSAASRRSAAIRQRNCCRWCRTEAGSSTPNCSSWPNGPACAPYFVGTNADSFGGGSGDASAITRWVSTHFRSRTVGGETIYDLAEPAG